MLKLVLQVKHAILLKKILPDFRFKALLSTYGVMMLTSTAVASNPESSNEPIPHNKLLINMTVQSVQQVRRRLEWNLENEAAKATQPKLPTSACHGWSAVIEATGLIWLPPMPDLHSHFLLLLFVYTNSCLPATLNSLVVPQNSLKTVLVDQQ